MSSVPVTPKPTESAATAKPTTNTGIITKIETDYTWLKTHVIILAITLGLVYGGITLTLNGVRKLIADHDASVAAEQQRAEGVDTTTQQTLLTQLQQEQTASAARDAQQTALIQTLIQQMTASRAATAKQVQTDSTADATATASHIAAQTKASPVDVTATPTTVTLSLPVARTVTTDLDEGVQAQADVTNLQGQLQAQQTINTDTKQQLTTAQQTITADKAELVQTVQADDAACTVKVNAAVSAQQTKDSKHNKIWGIIIFAAGALAGHGI